MGWVCAKGGEPGQWVNLSSIGGEQVAAPPQVAGGKGDGKEESEALREEVAELRQLVETLVGRVASLEAQPPQV